jgi:hypothetical protein
MSFTALAAALSLVLFVAMLAFTLSGAADRFELRASMG